MLKEWLTENNMFLSIINIKKYQDVTKAKLFVIKTSDGGFFLTETDPKLLEMGNVEFIVVDVVNTERREFTKATINPRFIVSSEEI